MTDASPAPGVPQTGTKAWVATGASAVVGFVLFWIADEDPFTAKEAAQGAVSALIGAGLVGAPTWAIRNRRK